MRLDTITTESSCRRGSLFLAALILLFVVELRPAFAQARTNQAPVILKAGDPCRSRADPRPGVLKVDACGRWYCGRAEVKDIIEVRPDIAERLGCEWQLVGERCRCVRNYSPPAPR
jgi:hypothetical protein